MRLKLVENKEIKELASLCSEIWHEYWPCILSNNQIEYMIEKFQSENAIKNQIQNENYNYYYLLNDNNVIIGYTGISEKENYTFLSKLYIKKEYRHLGYGKLAFEEIRNIARQNIRLTVNKYNKNTINAYLKYGFQIIDEDVTDIGNGFVMDDFIMEFMK